MGIIKNDSAQYDGREILVTAFTIIVIIGIVIWKWDIISQAISQIHSATCVSDPKSPWYNC